MAFSSEFELIDYIRRGFENIGDGTIEGIGDDCAVMPVSDDESLVFTTDMLCEGVHFMRDAASASEIGYKSLAVNLSDVAAMGARPVASMLSVSVPQECSGAWIRDFMDGYKRLSAEFGVALIGGDTVGSSGPVTVNVVAIGRIKSRNIKRRNAAKHGDIIAVNGTLGDSAAGLADVLAGRYDTPLARLHHHPVPQVNEGMWLSGRGEVHAMMDISDGIISDLPHILEASGLGADIHTDKIPTVHALSTALAGGEDYKLLFTASAGRFENLAADYKAHFGSRLYPIGHITSSKSGIRWFDCGEEIFPQFAAFRHF